MRTCAMLFWLVIALIASPSLAASVKIAGNVHGPYRVCVTAKGAALIQWSGGQVVVRPDGTLRYGASLPSGCRQSSTVRSSLPMSVAEYRRGTMRFALQAWRRLPGGPVELRFSRWRGAATRCTMQAAPRWSTERVYGACTFAGKPVPDRPFKAKPNGDPLDKWGRNIYIDSLIGGSWRRINAILLNYPAYLRDDVYVPAGGYSLYVQQNHVGTHYRGRVIGPNFTWVLAPDAEASTRSVR